VSTDKAVGFIRLGITTGFGIVAVCIGAATLSPAHAQSTNCAEFISKKIPLKLTYQNGFAMTVVERKGSELRSELIFPKGGKITTVTYGGLFTLRRMTSQGLVEYKWDRDVTQFFPLKIGEHIIANATMTLNNQVLNSGSEEHSVVARESYRIEDCDYPVLKIEFHNRFTMAPKEGDGIRYYHAASGLVLKSVSKSSATPWIPEHTSEERIVKLE
jgi:hypothetical protein